MVLLQLSEACGDSPSFLCESIYDLTDSNSFTSFSNNYLVKPLTVLGIMIGAMIVLKLLRLFSNSAGSSIAQKSARRIAKADENVSKVTLRRAELRATTLVAVLNSLATLLVWSAAVVIALSVFDVSLAPIFAGAGVLGIVIGFGAQDVVADFLSGFFMLFEDQFGVGDVVDLGEVSGVVEDVSLRTTTVRDVNGTVWHIRNSEIARVANKSQLWSRAVLDIDVAYDTDIRRAEGVIQRVADELWKDKSFTKGKIIEAPEVWGVENLGADGITIRLVVKTDPAEQFVIQRELRIRIKDALEQAGIEMPFAQRTVWIRNDETPPPRSERPAVEVAPIRDTSHTQEFTAISIEDDD